MTNLLFELSQYHAYRKPFVICIVTKAIGSTPRKAGSKMLVFEDGSIKGTIGGGSVELQAKKDAQMVMRQRESEVIDYQLEEDLAMQCGGNMSVYFEPIFPAEKLYVFGAGHVGREVGFYAQTLGFNVTYIDHRPDIYKEFDAGNTECLVGNYVEVIDHLSLNSDSYAVIVTPNHSFDEEVLEKLAMKDLKYLGMMGSKRKVLEVTKRLQEENKLTKEQLEKVDMPIGIPLKVETPGEIAISIVAKMTDVRNS